MKSALTGTFAVSFILLAVLFNYAAFNNKNVAYLIIFLCFAALCFLISKLLYDKAESYDEVEKKMDREHENSEDFIFLKDGFRFKKDKSEVEIIYSEILKISFLKSSWGYHQTSHGLEIVSINGTFYFDQETTNSYVKLTDQLYGHLDISDLSQAKTHYINSKTTLITVFEK